MDCQESLNLAYFSSQTEEQHEEKVQKQTKKQAHVENTRIAACVVDRQKGRESRSLDSLQVKRGDISVVSAPSCLACQEGQDQDSRSKNMLVMMCHCSRMVHEAKAGGHRRKGRRRGGPGEPGAVR